MVRQQSSSLSPNLSPCRSSGNHYLRLFQKPIEDFDCKINCWALWHSLCGSNWQLMWQAQTHSVCKSFQVVSFHFSEVNELLNVKLCWVKKFQHQSNSNAITCINKGLLSRFLVYFNFQLEQSGILSREWQFYTTGFKIWMSYTFFFFGRSIHWQTYGPEFRASHNVTECVGQHGFNLKSNTVLKFFAAALPFCMALSKSVHWQERFCIAVLSIISSGVISC